MIGSIHLTPQMNSQFEITQAKTLDGGGPDQYFLPGGLVWFGDWSRGWDIKQKGEMLDQNYLRACTSRL